MSKSGPDPINKNQD